MADSESEAAHDHFKMWQQNSLINKFRHQTLKYPKTVATIFFMKFCASDIGM